VKLLRARTRLDRASRCSLALCALGLLAAAACSSRSSHAGSDSAVAAQLDAGGDASEASGALPAAFKGYELYAWDEDGELVYTLITGTNRQKTLAEIMPGAHETQDGEWVVVSGRGLEALARTIARVPAGTSVTLADLEGVPALSDAHRDAIVDLLPR
jgi:hypothetical protein